MDMDMDMDIDIDIDKDKDKDIDIDIDTDIWSHAPPRSTPASSTRFHRLLLYSGPLLIYAEKNRKYRYNRAFRHVHGNRAATSRGFDMCIHLAPNLGRRCMIVNVLDNLKCWRACYFCSCSTD